MQEEIAPQDLVLLEATEAKRADAERLQRHTEVEDFRWLMGTKQGRRIVWRLLSKTGLYACAMRSDSETQFLNGVRNMGVFLMAEINELCSEKYHLMVKEQQEHDNRKRNAA